MAQQGKITEPCAVAGSVTSHFPAEMLEITKSNAEENRGRAQSLRCHLTASPLLLQDFSGTFLVNVT